LGAERTKIYSGRLPQLPQELLVALSPDMDNLHTNITLSLPALSGSGAMASALYPYLCPQFILARVCGHVKECIVSPGFQFCLI